MLLKRYNKLSDYVRRHFSTLAPYLTAHKLFNILLAISEMKLRRTKCFSRPFMFRMDPCSLCNLRCVSCSSYKRKTDEKRTMDLDDFKDIVDKIKKYAIRTSLYDLGEPLLNKKIYEMIRYASDNRISTLISTNLNLFREDDVEKLLDSKLTVLEPCLDGFTQESYEKYRQGGDVEVVKNGIKNVLEYRNKKNLKWPLVDVQVVLFDHIKDELELIDSFLHKYHVDRITYRQESLGFNSSETTIKGKSTVSEEACFWLYLGMAVSPDGSVYPCCGRSTTRIPYGNILTQDLSEIWNNKYYKFTRSLFSKGDDLAYDIDMSRIPCFKCNEFRKQREMVRKQGGTASSA